jgi:hypothetical protein
MESKQHILVNNWWLNGGKQPQDNSWGFFFSLNSLKSINYA